LRPAATTTRRAPATEALRYRRPIPRSTASRPRLSLRAFGRQPPGYIAEWRRDGRRRRRRQDRHRAPVLKLGQGGGLRDPGRADGRRDDYGRHRGPTVGQPEGRGLPRRRLLKAAEDAGDPFPRPARSRVRRARRQTAVRRRGSPHSTATTSLAQAASLRSNPPVLASRWASTLVQATFGLSWPLSRASAYTSPLCGSSCYLSLVSGACRQDVRHPRRPARHGRCYRICQPRISARRNQCPRSQSLPHRILRARSHHHVEEFICPLEP
jgi:hypothetical protein